MVNDRKTQTSGPVSATSLALVTSTGKRLRSNSGNFPEFSIEGKAGATHSKRTRRLGAACRTEVINRETTARDVGERYTHLQTIDGFSSLP